VAELDFEGATFRFPQSSPLGGLVQQGCDLLAGGSNRPLNPARVWRKMIDLGGGQNSLTATGNVEVLLDSV
jgi:hypothetical protein